MFLSPRVKKITGPSGAVVCHSKLTLKQNAKVIDNRQKPNCCFNAVHGRDKRTIAIGYIPLRNNVSQQKFIREILLHYMRCVL